MSDEKNKFPSTFVSSQFVKYIDQKEIKGIVEALGNTLSQRYQGQELVLIGVLKGSTVFMADLIREIKGVKIYVDFVRLQAVGRSKENQGTILISKDITTNLMDRNVVIVEEIVDTGRALNFLKKRIQLSSPRSLEVVTLFDKPYKRAVNIQPDMTGKKIEDQFVVGYGLDLEDFGRNFEQLYYLRYPN
ncbi:MAG: hypoxanthine phosphoribosyltransferase [Bacteriovoracaceae bacterium]